MRDCGLSLNIIIIFIIVTAAVCAMLAVYQARFRVPYVCYSFNPHNMLFPLPGNTVLPNLVMAGFLSFRSHFRYHLFRGPFPNNPIYTPPTTTTCHSLSSGFFSSSLHLLLHEIVLIFVHCMFFPVETSWMQGLCFFIVLCPVPNTVLGIE